MGGKAEEVSLRTVLVDIVQEGVELSVARLEYMFSSHDEEGNHFFVKFVNLTGRMMFGWGEGYKKKLHPFGERSIDMERIKIDISDALKIAGRNGGSDFLGKVSPDHMQIDLHLSPGESRAMFSNPKYDCVWAVTYDAWEPDGPAGYLNIQINAETGDIIEVYDQM